MTYVKYTDSVEEIDDGEPELFAKIADTFVAQSGKVRDQLGRAVRASHAKSTGALEGELVVLGGLAPELAQGLFARPGRYDVLVRLAQGPGELLDDMNPCRSSPPTASPRTVHGRLVDFRQGANNVPGAEPRSLADVPDAESRMADMPG